MQVNEECIDRILPIKNMLFTFNHPFHLSCESVSGYRSSCGVGAPYTKVFHPVCFRFVFMYRSSFDEFDFIPLFTTATVLCTRSNMSIGGSSTNVATRDQCGNFASQNMMFNFCRDEFSCSIAFGDSSSTCRLPMVWSNHRNRTCSTGIPSASANLDLTSPSVSLPSSRMETSLWCVK